eukprot:3973713-Pleurochrysis_carterae.AAC.3
MGTRLESIALATGQQQRVCSCCQSGSKACSLRYEERGDSEAAPSALGGTSKGGRGRVVPAFAPRSSVRTPPSCRLQAGRNRSERPAPSLPGRTHTHTHAHTRKLVSVQKNTQRIHVRARASAQVRAPRTRHAPRAQAPDRTARSTVREWSTHRVALCSRQFAHGPFRAQTADETRALFAPLLVLDGERDLTNGGPVEPVEVGVVEGVLGDDARVGCIGEHLRDEVDAGVVEPVGVRHRRAE